MNPKKAYKLRGARLAFVQGGPEGAKLVHVTPPIEIRPHGHFYEAKWSPKDMPLKYASAPVVMNNENYSDFPFLKDQTCGVRRRTGVSKFASKFRSRREPLPKRIGEQVIAEYEKFRRRHSQVAITYHEAMPYPPPCLVNRKKRKERYDRLLGRLSLAPQSKRRKAC